MENPREAGRRLAFLFCVSALAGCAVQPPVMPVERADAIRGSLQSEPSAIVASGCAYRDEVGNDYVYEDESLGRAQHAAAALLQLLTDAGVPVGGEPVVVLCGGFAMDDTLLAATRPKRNRSESGKAGSAGKPALPEPKSVAWPVIHGSSLDEHSAAALAAVLAEVASAAPSAADGKGEPRRLQLPEDEAARLRDQLGARYLWFAAINSGEISFGKALAMATVTAVAVTAAAGIYQPYVVSVVSPTEGNQHQLALVDLARRELVWKTDPGQDFAVRHVIREPKTPEAPWPYDLDWARAIAAPMAPLFGDAGHSVQPEADSPPPQTATR